MRQFRRRITDTGFLAWFCDAAKQPAAAAHVIPGSRTTRAPE